MATNDVGELLVGLRLDKILLKKDFNSAKASFSKFSRNVTKTSVNLGKNMTQSLSVPLSQFKTQSTNAAKGFQSAMNHVQSVSGATGKELEDLKAKLRSLSVAAQVAATKVGRSFLFLEQNSAIAIQTMAGIPSILETIAKTMLGVSAIISVFNFKVLELGILNSLLGQSLLTTNVNLVLLGQSLALVGAIASVASIPLITLSQTFTQILSAITSASLLVQQFGQQIGPLLLPLIMQGSGALMAMRIEFENLGLVIQSFVENQITALNEALNNLISTFGQLSGVISGTGNGLATGTGSITGVGPGSTATTGTGEKGQSGKSTGFLDSILNTLKPLEQLAIMLTNFIALGEAIAGLFGTTLGKALGSLGRALWGVVRGGATALIRALTFFILRLGPWGLAIGAFAVGFAIFGDDIKRIAKDTWDSVTAEFEGFTQFLDPWIERIGSSLNNLVIHFQSVTNAPNEAAAAIANALSADGSERRVSTVTFAKTSDDGLAIFDKKLDPRLSLNLSAVPEKATGISRVPQDMLAFLHKGETVLNRSESALAGAGMGGLQIQGDVVVNVPPGMSNPREMAKTMLKEMNTILRRQSGKGIGL